LSTASLEALCDGWVEGALAGSTGRTADGQIDVLQFAPLTVLAHRARQHHEQGFPAIPLVLVVVVLDDDLVLAHPGLIADHVQAVFGGGETLARGRRGPLLILTPRLPSLAERTRALIVALAADPVLGVA
ncbi:unnamed protein product, partial [Phaeothamnion confervicola]